MSQTHFHIDNGKGVIRWRHGVQQEVVHKGPLLPIKEYNRVFWVILWLCFVKTK